MFEISISGIKKVTLKEKYDFFYLPWRPTQETQAHTVSICEYTNMFTLRNEWDIRICRAINSRALNLKKFWTIFE